MNDLILSLITGIFVGGAAALLGSLMVSRRMALAGDALGHIALPGIGLALLFNFDVTLGAVIFLVLGIILIYFLNLKTSLPMEALVGIVFVASLALGFLIIPGKDLEQALIGDISKVSFNTAIISLILSLFAIFIIKIIYKKIVLLNVSEDLAKVNGIDAKKYNFIYLLLIALVVALGIKVTGTLLVGALLIVPASSSRNLTKSLKGYSFFSAIFGILSCIIGIIVANYFSITAGPIIILISSAFFLLSLVFKKG